jgi:hypothetical protein
MKTDAEVTEQIIKSYYNGYRAALCNWAYWKDGVQYVGTTGTLLRDALSKADQSEEASIAESKRK